MTYNVFSGTLKLTLSICLSATAEGGCLLLRVGSMSMKFVDDDDDDKTDGLMQDQDLGKKGVQGSSDL